MPHNEDSRVKIPGLIHLTRLGFEYLSVKDLHWDDSSNVIPMIFDESIRQINPDVSLGDIQRERQEVLLTLDNEDLGRAFYRRLVRPDGIKLIDLERFERNQLHVVTEFTCKNGADEFRPDITLLINGMPLVFIEVKKPNNREGILAERKRIEMRFENPKFKRFINITQLMVFSNNMEYDDTSPEPLEGAFYSSTAKGMPPFNYFREERAEELPDLPEIESVVEDFILRDTNLPSIRHSPEYATNKNPNSPTNRLFTSLFSRDRLCFLLKYGIAYVNKETGLEKHVMRYPQIFATKAIQDSLEAGKKKGVIWHTQGSGKTALAYFNVKHLTDTYQAQGTIPKFYFIVDRLDLLTQAAREFRSRGLTVHEVDSKEEFTRDIKSTMAVHNAHGHLEITVVNIQKFAEDPNVVQQTDYNLGLQRVYFLDEVHRSYNPTGSFLANLKESDPNAVMIGLTGTPLLGTDASTKALFGGYIHKYYYNSSIKDGYTLRLIREEIATEYKMALAEALKNIDVLKGSAERKYTYSHPTFVGPMLKYIVEDFERARIAHGDNSIGAMVICDSSEQAKAMMDLFQTHYADPQTFHVHEAPLAYEEVGEPLRKVAERQDDYGSEEARNRKAKRAELILYDVGSKDDRKAWVEDFKDGKVDILFVYNMLLTGFDSARLKKLYLGRVVKAHNLLQALTRANRTYKKFRYGYIVDFADIESEFEKTNKAYFDELQSELGNEMDSYSNLFKTEEEILAEVEQIKDALWTFDTGNAEVFSQQITEIHDRKQMQEIVRALRNARELYNVIRQSGRHELLDKLDFHKLKQLSSEAENHLAMINQKIALEEGHDHTNLLNLALEDLLFTFRKTGEGELKIADELKDQLRRTRETLGGNFDQASAEFISLKEELERLFKKKKLTEISKEEMEENIDELRSIEERARELNRQNNLLRAKYANDAKYARLHKRLVQKYPRFTDRERQLFEALNDLKVKADQKIFQNAQLLKNEGYAEKEMLRLSIEQLNTAHGFDFSVSDLKEINRLIMTEYLNEYHGTAPAA